MNALYFWEPRPGLSLNDQCNPYGPLLAQALAPRGIHLEWASYDMTVEWLEEQWPRYQVLHLNWLNHFYRGNDLAEAVAAYTRFAEMMTRARKIGYRIVWTFHNHYPHERPFPDLDHLAQLLICRLAHAVTAHCGYAAGLLRDEFHCESEIAVVPHGHFIDAFPNRVSRQEARAKLDLPENAFVYIFFGNARVYKGIERLVKAFEKTADENALLLLMMRASFNADYSTELEKLTSGNPQIRVFTSEFFANSEFQYFLNSADVAALPFSAILTSGSAITALGFGVPTILPRLGCMPELIDGEQGVLYDAGDPQGLEGAMVEVRKRDLKTMQTAARSKAETLDWDGIAGQVAKLYQADHR